MKLGSSCRRWLPAATVGLACGCTAAPPAPTPTVATPTAAPASARLIVRFRPDAPDPTDPAFRARLARAAGVDAVDLIRPMSGDAFVMRIDCPAVAGTPDPCAGPLARLRAVDEVVDLEIDARAKIQ